MASRGRKSRHCSGALREWVRALNRYQESNTDIFLDVCGGLISEEETIIPIHNWRPRDMSCIEASQMFLSFAETNFDTFTNYTVYLCAQTLGVLFGTKSPHPCTSCQPLADDDGNSYVRRWREVFSHAEQWYENRPSQMKSIFTISTTSHSGRNQPFPTVLYGNGDASMIYPAPGLIYTNRFSLWESIVPYMRPLAAPAKAKDFGLAQETSMLAPFAWVSSLTDDQKSVLWHARQICAISASNAHQ